MKKILFAIIALVMLAGCKEIMPSQSGQGTAAQVPSTQAVSGSPGASAGASAQTEPLAALLPDKTGFQWQYSGFAEYAMAMSLKNISQSGNETLYTTEGSVADMSGGAEASGDFTVRITYTVSPGILKQNLEGQKAMDSGIPEIELVRAPLAQGTQWRQQVKLDGRDIVLDCTITGVKTKNNRKVYSISYKQQGSDYYELRDVTEGLGVTSFQKLFTYNGGSDLVGYQLYTQHAQATIETYKQWLPDLGKEYIYFGLAEYGHKGKLILISSDDKEDIYECQGIFADGMGDESKFVIRYHVDLARGTVTEQVISNERGGAEVNSKLHNLVVLKFPLSLGEQWNHEAKLNGKAVTVQATVTQYDEEQGIVKVRYTAKGAAGYYDNIYIEERTFEKGYGMTGFSNLMPGDIGISAEDAKNAEKLDEAVRQHSFGYSMNKQTE
jgi:hypothetical protein